MRKYKYLTPEMRKETKKLLKLQEENQETLGSDSLGGEVGSRREIHTVKCHKELK